jgi:hypothetical protein
MDRMVQISPEEKLRRRKTADRQRAWYAANREKGRASVRAWNGRNRERLAQHHRAWYAAHAEEQRKRSSASKKRRLAERPEEVHRYFKSYRQRRVRMRVAEARARHAPHSYFQDLGPEFGPLVKVPALGCVRLHARQTEHLIDSVFLDYVHTDVVPQR